MQWCDPRRRLASPRKPPFTTAYGKDIRARQDHYVARRLTRRTTANAIMIPLVFLVRLVFSVVRSSCARSCPVLAVAVLASGPWMPDALARQQATPRSVAPRGDLSAEERATIDVFRRSSASVVYITTLQRVVSPWTRNVREVPQGTGSGFVWDEHGHVVTNAHVITGAQGAMVRLADQQAYPAQLVGVSSEHDLAVLRITVPGRRPPPLPLGTSRDLQVGQKVIAIGNPFGLDYTLTTGVVSALRRSIPTEEGEPIHNLIQTDAAINPGNSGGPLLDSAGRLIGVNTAIYSPSGASAGIGFAVPVDTVNRVVPELIAFGKYQQPSLGVVIEEGVSRAVTTQLGVKGLLVLDVERGSPAAAAGLRGARLAPDGRIVPGDVIVAIDGTPVDSAEALGRMLDAKRIGDRVTVRLWREGKTVEVAMTLAARRG